MNITSNLKSQVQNEYFQTYFKPEFKKNKNKIRYYLIIFFISLLLMILICSLVVINIRFANNGKYNFQDLAYIFGSNNIFDNNLNQIKQITTSNNEIFGQFFINDLVPIRRAVWISIASVCGGMGLAIAGAISQGLTKNPLADSTTLGITETSIFGAILLSVLFGNIINANIYQYVFVSLAFLGSTISILLLLLIMKFSEKNISYLKITLAGLAITIMFRTINLLLRSTSSKASADSLRLALGGAENVYNIYPNQETIMYLGIGLIVVSLVIAIIFSRHLTLLELGDQKANTLGINVNLVKTVGFILIFAIVPIAISLVGNVAFIGLFAPHIVRLVFRTRNYSIILPISALLGAATLLIGLTFNTFLTTIPSSIWMVFIGAPVLIYLGWTKKIAK